MSNPQIIVPGIDLSTFSSPSPAQIDQAIRTARPVSGIGGVVLSANAPDVVTYPAFTSFIWSETVDNIDYVPLGNLYSFNGTTWVKYETTTATNLLNGSIGLEKLATPGANNSSFLLRATGSGGGYELIPPASAIADGGLPVAKLTSAGNSKMLVTSSTGAVQFIDQTTIINPVVNAATAAAFLAQAVPLANLSIASAGSQKVIAYSGSAVIWSYVDALIRDNTITIFALTPEGATNKIMRSNSVGTSFEYATLNHGYITATADLVTLPAITGASVTFNHGLGSKPHRVGAFIECVVADGVFAVGDRIPWDRVYPSDSQGLGYNATIIKITRIAGGGTMQVSLLDGSARYAITMNHWKCGAWADYIF